ncbi:hypothetical protein [Paraburkholderia sp. RL17-337-BIB-A]|uniref:hypothetical protein n=1 Tax=Paraburkholderia sp. RL17-337-BIB-A TaxID=3031636 RepID=UPI0038BD0069
MTIFSASSVNLTKKDIDNLYAWLLKASAKPAVENFSGTDSEFSMSAIIVRQSIFRYDPESQTEETLTSTPDSYHVKIKLCGPVGPMFERQFG